MNCGAVVPLAMPICGAMFIFMSVCFLSFCTTTVRMHHKTAPQMQWTRSKQARIKREARHTRTSKHTICWADFGEFSIPGNRTPFFAISGNRDECEESRKWPLFVCVGRCKFALGGIGTSLVGAHDDACARGTRGGLSSRLSHCHSPPDDATLQASCLYPSPYASCSGQ